MTRRKIIAVDFDGVLHSYTSPWTDVATVADPPTPGAMRFLRDLVVDGRFEVIVVSSRLAYDDGEQAVLVWLDRHLRGEFGPSDGEAISRQIDLSATRPPAFVTLDDRALTFVGEWPSLDRIAAFQPWNKKPRHHTTTPETAQAVADALLQRIQRLAAETGWKGGDPFEWVERMARIGGQLDDDMQARVDDALAALEGPADEDEVAAAHVEGRLA